MALERFHSDKIRDILKKVKERFSFPKLIVMEEDDWNLLNEQMRRADQAPEECPELVDARGILSKYGLGEFLELKRIDGLLNNTRYFFYPKTGYGISPPKIMRFQSPNGDQKGEAHFLIEKR